LNTKLIKKFTGLAAATIAVASLTTSAIAADMKVVGLSTIVEVPALLDVKNGIIEGLAEKGFVEGKNLKIVYENANGNMPTQQQIAKKFAGMRPDLIIGITTPTSQALAAATRDIPMIFTAVTDPIKAKLITQFKKPGGRITGISDIAPLARQLDLMLEIIPGTKKIGFIYNPGLDNAVAALAVLRKAADAKGVEIVESPAPTSNEVIVAARKLVGKVQAIYVPNDTTVVAALEAIVKVAQDTDTPLFAGETSAVERGALASIGHNYKLGGVHTGYMAAAVLNGANPGDIDALRLADLNDAMNLYINRGSAEKMGVTVPQAVLDRAFTLID